jgi:pimeloyl-ACP methyl ester carboxylesterase
MSLLSRRAFGLGAAALLLPAGARAAGGIDERGYVRIGGIDQWVAIQGNNRDNPVILYLHGGPGEAQSPFLDTFKPWLADFTVVNWDQRGAGKTYEKNGDATPDMTLDREVADAVALSEYALNKLGRKKLVLVGQSAGAALGLKVVQRRPDLYAAFVGTGQMVSVMRSAAWQEKQINVPPTHDATEMKTLHQWAITSPPDQPYLKRMTDFMARPEAAAWVKGYDFESGHVGPEMQAFDAMTDALDLAVPYILIQGRADWLTPMDVAKEYFDAVRSKGKVFVPVDGGHFACFTNAGEFVAALRKHVVPLTRA